MPPMGAEGDRERNAGDGGAAAAGPAVRVEEREAESGQPAQAPADGAQGDGAGGPPAEQVVERDERRAKMERLRAEGIEPYPHGSWMEQRTLISDVLAAHDASQLAAGEHRDMRYLIAGRLVSRRGHGKTSFLDLRDLSGSIQLVVRADALGREKFDRVMGLDIGDIVGVEGFVYVTQRGQLALAVQECTLLTKTLRPPPDKHHGLGDTGTRYRYRELDLIANEETRDLFIKRARIVAAIRQWLDERNFVEV